MFATATIALRLYLLGGLLLHKLVWEVMKRRDSGWRETRAPGATGGTDPVKLAKIAFLTGIIVQTLLPDRWAALFPVAADPAGVRAAGVALFGAGLLIAILGRVQLGRSWADIEDAGVHSEQRLVDRGLYAFIRHPIYTGDIVMLIGMELALNSWLVLGMIVLAPVVARQAIREEEMLARKLPDYDAYRRRTKRFVPFVY